MWNVYRQTARHVLLTNLRIYLLTPWSRVHLEKLTCFQLVKKFPSFYGTRRFITAVTSARHLSLSCASSFQSIPPHPTSWRSIFVLSSHLRLGLPIGLFHSVFHTKTSYTPLLSPIRTKYPAHNILLGFITRTTVPHYVVFSTLLLLRPSGANILLSTLFSNTLSLRSSLNVNDQVSHQ